MIIIQLDSEQLFSLIEKAVSKAINENPVSSGTEKEDLMTLGQCAQFLNLSPKTIYGLTHARKIPFMKRGKRCYFSRKDLVQYLEEGRKQTASEMQSEVSSNLKKKHR